VLEGCTSESKRLAIPTLSQYLESLKTLSDPYLSSYARGRLGYTLLLNLAVIVPLRYWVNVVGNSVNADINAVNIVGNYTGAYCSECVKNLT
jgi:hypothetical protein